MATAHEHDPPADTPDGDQGGGDVGRARVGHLAGEGEGPTLLGPARGLTGRRPAQDRVAGHQGHHPGHQVGVVGRRQQGAFGSPRHAVEEHLAGIDPGLALQPAGDKTLSGSKYLWLYSEENLPERHQHRFAAMRGADLKTGRAWAIKENLRIFWDYRRRGWAERHWKSWYFWATHSRLQPIIDAAHTLKRDEAGLLSFFAHRITNAGAEGLNSRIQAIRVSARGFRNREHFKTAIYFHCGGLDLYPVTH